MKIQAVVTKQQEQGVGRDPVQDGRRTMKTLGEFNVSVPVAHTPIVSPLARDLILYGFPGTLKTLRGNKYLSLHYILPQPLAHAV